MLKNFIIDQQKETPNLTKVLQVEPTAFLNMFTYNDVNRRHSNSWLLEACIENLSKHVKGGFVNINSIYIERNSILKVDQTKKQVQKVTDAELLETSPKNLVCNRAIIKIEVEGLSQDYFPAIAINLNEHGEEIAFGGNVKICNNFTILSAERRFSTFEKRKKISTNELLEQVKKLFPKTEKILAKDLKQIEQLKQTPVTRKQWNGFVGKLFGQIHYVNKMRLARRIAEVPNEIKALPITANLLAEITAEGYKPSYNSYEWEENVSNKWKVLNFGTEKTKAIHGISTKSVLDVNANWTKTVLDYNFSNN